MADSRRKDDPPPTWEQLVALYRPKRKPDPACTTCNGRGERWVGGKFVYLRAGWRPCMCLFVEGQDMRDFAQNGLNQIVQEEREKLRRGESVITALMDAICNPRKEEPRG